MKSNFKWTKRGLIFVPDHLHDDPGHDDPGHDDPGHDDHGHEWMSTHAQLPVVDTTIPSVLRIYFGTRDKQNRSVAAFVDVDPENPGRVIRAGDSPALGLGELGSFDDCGVIPSSIVNHGGRKFLYYVGVNTSTTVPYRYSIGLAESTDGGITFHRNGYGPVVERTFSEPHLCTAPCVLAGNPWRMWYVAGLGWEMADGKPEPLYNIRYTESPDGIAWTRPGRVAVEIKNQNEGGIGRPAVMVEDGLYRMWFSFRGRRDYRSNRTQTYRIGYAESGDGLEWDRRDEMAGIDISDAGWDSEMIAYPHVFRHREQTFMVYNGNGFGRSGFGYAVLETE